MRLISLCPSMTHTLFRLGVGDQLVGITRYCIHPAAEIARIEKVGGTKNPKMERILALKADLVFLNREENRREDWEQLQAAGQACHISHPLDVETTRQMLQSVGSAVARESEAASLIAEIDAARERVLGLPAEHRQASWAYLIWRKPYMTVNRTSYIHGLLAEIAPNNIFGNHSAAYPETSAEELASLRPDRILLSSEPFPFKNKHLEELAIATGLSPKRFLLVDGERLSWHGGMTAMGLAYAHELFRSDETALT